MARGRTVKYPPKRGNLKRSEVKRVVEKVVLGRHGGGTTTSGISKMREMRKYRDYLIEELSDPEEATAYLEVSREEYQKDGDAVAFLLALQNIAEAQAENDELVSQVYLLSGEVHLSRGEHDLAIEDYGTVIQLTNTVIETDPNNAEAYIRRGIAYHHKGESGFAIENFTKAIELDPNIHQLYLARGITYHYEGEYDFAY